MTQATPDFAAARPRMDGDLQVAGIRGSVTIHRDGSGVAHIQAENEHDAWFGQGFAAAQDRLWQMESDRRRATGRWSEATGPDARYGGQRAITGDILARRLRLGAAAQADINAMTPATREMFESYAQGVNAFINSGEPLPPEYELCGIKAEPWQPWHSVAIFKIRHVLMGLWQQKVAWGQLAVRYGAEALHRLPSGTAPGSTLILPPDSEASTAIEQAALDIEAARDSLGFLSEIEAGSNSWAVHGSRTTSGQPIVCNDSHRALDVPNAYWQVHVSFPGVNVAGATFAGVPGFPHFGFNGHVAWNITHTQGDYQDLYIERFNPDDPGMYDTPKGPALANRREERIHVSGQGDTVVETWETEHGPVVHGDPRKGYALALRYSATDRPCRQWEALRPMLHAETVEELFDTQADWVDPVNNLVAADSAGNIGYLCRGRLPTRASRAGRRLPVPGWTGEHEWTGDVPFEDMPRSVNPPEGFIATANQRVLDEDEPYISELYATAGRAKRLVELLGGDGKLAPDDIAAMQGDVTSVYARAWAELLAEQGTFEGDAERTRQMLAGWDGELAPNSGLPLLYACFRRRMAQSLVTGAFDEAAWDWLSEEGAAARNRIAGTWLANTAEGLRDRYRYADPLERHWESVLPPVLAAAWRDTVAVAGEDPNSWHWADHHATAAQHPLCFVFPALSGSLNPPSAAVGGDPDTLQCAGYPIAVGAAFDINLLSVYRQVVDFAKAGDASFVVPGGASGLPETAHYADQIGHWQAHERIPMYHEPGTATKAAEQTLHLVQDASRTAGEAE